MAVDPIDDPLELFVEGYGRLAVVGIGETVVTKVRGSLVGSQGQQRNQVGPAFTGHQRFLDDSVRLESLLDLLGCDILPACSGDDVFLPIDDLESTVGGYSTNVARV